MQLPQKCVHPMGRHWLLTISERLNYLFSQLQKIVLPIEQNQVDGGLVVRDCDRTRNFRVDRDWPRPTDRPTEGLKLSVGYVLSRLVFEEEGGRRPLPLRLFVLRSDVRCY